MQGLRIAVGSVAVAFCLFQSVARAADSVPDMSGRAMTVLGAVAPEELGVTLPHEHVFIDFTLPLEEPERWPLGNRPYPQTPEAMAVWRQPITMDQLAFLTTNIWGNRDALLIDSLDTQLAEVAAFKRAGGRTIVDVTSIGIGRDPRRLAELARRSGLNIVMGAGWYRTAWHPKGHELRDVASLTRQIVEEITVGIDGTGIRAGIIGEVSAMDVVTDPRDSAEVKGLRAAARTSRKTGAAISVHQWVRDGKALRQTLDILVEEGADLSRVIIGHIDSVSIRDNLAPVLAALERGVTVEFDLLGTPYYLSDPRLDHRPMADAVVDLVKRGYGGRILLSHDICTKLQLKTYGGKGFDYISTEVVPYLRKQGLTEQQLRQITIDTPRRLLTFAAPGRG